MAALTPISRKPMSMVLPSVALAGAFAGVFVGAGNGSVFLGILGGAALIAAVAWVYITVLKNEQLARWINIFGFGIVGFLASGLMGGVLGLLSGWFFVWFIYWLYEGRYRRKLLPYLTPKQVFYHYLFRVICGAIFVFLITPILVVLP
ncbi:MAG: ABC transporter permease, partial [Pseudomonadota bacterium]